MTIAIVLRVHSLRLPPLIQMTLYEVMPHHTALYEFEYKIFKAVNDLCVVLYGSPTACLIIFNQAGIIQRISFEKSEVTWFEEVDSLRSQKQPHLFFDPTGIPGHIWLSWLGAHQSSMERITQSPLEASDFHGRDSTTDVKSLSHFPSIWDVVFKKGRL